MKSRTTGASRANRSVAPNPYINRYGGRTRYAPHRAKDPARKPHYQQPGVPVPLTGEQKRRWARYGLPPLDPDPQLVPLFLITAPESPGFWGRLCRRIEAFLSPPSPPSLSELAAWRKALAWAEAGDEAFGGHNRHHVGAIRRAMTRAGLPPDKSP